MPSCSAPVTSSIGAPPFRLTSRKATSSSTLAELFQAWSVKIRENSRSGRAAVALARHEAISPACDDAWAAVSSRFPCGLLTHAGRAEMCS